MLVTYNIYGQIWYFGVFLVCGASSDAEILVGETGTADPKPIVLDYNFDDDGAIQAIVNPSEPNFVVYLSKQSSSLGRNVIYRYNADKSSIDKVDITLGQDSISVDEVIPSGDHMFCISYSSNRFFFMDDDFKTHTKRVIDPSFDYVPHPAHVGYIARKPKLPQSSYVLEISDDSGYTFPKSFADVQKFDWVDTDEEYSLVIKTSRGVKVILLKGAFDPEKSSNEPTFLWATDYKISGSDILLINNLSGLFTELVVYEVVNDEQDNLIHPALLKIKNIVSFDYVFGRYYVTLVDETNETCLWVTIDEYFHLGRRVCWSNPSTHQFSKSDVLIGRRLKGILYANNIHVQEKVTYMSANSGKSWQKLHISSTGTSTQAESLEFDLAQYDPRSVPNGWELIDIQTVKSIPRQSCITFDGGLTWSYIPHSSFKAISLDYDSVLVSVSQSSKEIKYSLFHGNIWKTHTVYTSIPTILYAGQITSQFLKVLIASREQDHGLHFIILDFSSFFDYTCTQNQYTIRWLPNLLDSCYLGKKAFYKSRDTKEMCWDKGYSFKLEFTEECDCKPANLECDFGYVPHEDLCIKDKHSQEVEQPVNCDHLSPDQALPSRYVKSTGDSCDPSKLSEMDKLFLQREYCNLNDRTNFLVLFENNEIGIVHIQDTGELFSICFIYSVPIDRRIELTGSWTINYAEKLIYTYSDRSIIIYGFDTKFLPKTLYCIQGKVIRMEFEPVSSNLIYLSEDKKLGTVSLLTNFEYVISVNVTSFGYNQHDRTISFSTENCKLCYGILFASPRCVIIPFTVIKSLIDSLNLRAFFLTSLKTLKINRIETTEYPFQEILEINDISDFVVYGDHVYYLQEATGLLFHQSLAPDQMEASSLFPTKKFNRILVHPASWAGLNDMCQTKTCQFWCNPSSRQAKCVCPTSNVLIEDLKCSCPIKEPQCMQSHCRGFFCSNGRCLPEYVRCNGVDDCGDKSDEADCIEKYQSHIRICSKKVAPKDPTSGSMNRPVKPILEEDQIASTVHEIDSNVTDNNASHRHYIDLSVSILSVVLTFSVLLLLVYFYFRIHWPHSSRSMLLAFSNGMRPQKAEYIVHPDL